MTGTAGVSDPWLDDAPAYAIGALDGEERAAFEAHLATCAACAAEVRAYREVATVLARDVSGPAAAPSPALRARIMAAVGATAAHAPAAPPTGLATAPSNALPIRSRTATASIRAITPARRAPAWGPWLAAAASLVLAVALGSGWARERAVRVAERRDAIVALRRVADARRAIADAERQRSAAERDTLVVALTAPSVRVARLAAAGEPAAMRLLWNPERGLVVLTAATLPSPHAGRTYQLWGIVRGGAPQSLGVFAPGANGAVSAVMHVPRAAEMQVAAVTEEPAGGSVQPTSAPLMVGDLRGS